VAPQKVLSRSTPPVLWPPGVQLGKPAHANLAWGVCRRKCPVRARCRAHVRARCRAHVRARCRAHVWIYSGTVQNARSRLGNARRRAQAHRGSGKARAPGDFCATDISHAWSSPRTGLRVCLDEGAMCDYTCVCERVIECAWGVRVWM